MDTFWSEAIVLEAALISVLLGLWITWLGLRGLLLLMPAPARPAANRKIQIIQLAGNQDRVSRKRDAA